MRFSKMQGLGNDYVYLDCTKEAPKDLPGLAVKISDRHFGVGSDGLICIFTSEIADFRMRMFNADGSEGKMCGNGIRCVGKFVRDMGLTGKDDLTVETLSGVKRLHLTRLDKQGAMVTVDMGEPTVGEAMTLSVGGEDYLVFPVSMGNPHIVLFLDEIASLDLKRLGPQFENHPKFPDKVNTEFVRPMNFTEIDMRVWERGSGETLACGTGACAAAVAAMCRGKLDREATVHLRGGDLRIRWEAPEAGGHVYMTGPAVTVFEGEWPEND